MMDPRRIDTADNQANEQLATTPERHADLRRVSADGLPTHAGMMQEPVRAIDSCIGKDQLRKVCKQLFAQNLQLQTTVRNLQIEVQNSSQTSKVRWTSGQGHRQAHRIRRAGRTDDEGSC
ncbi:hypothetical protein [Stenotrophomonas phage CM2]